jgi:uncharacterized OB-fold protein
MAEGKLPVVPFLKIPESGDPYLEGHKCSECDAIVLQSLTACPSCGARESYKPIKLANKGKLYVYSIVHRSFPGVDVPYVSAVVDLEGGGTVKGNLINIDPTPEKVKFGMPVETIFQTAPRKDSEGNEYLTYYFQPCA